MRHWLLVLLCLLLLAGCGAAGTHGPAEPSHSPYDPPVRKNPPVLVGAAVVASPRRLTGVAPCSVVAAADVAHWVGRGTATPTAITCHLRGDRGQVEILLGVNDSVYSASQVPIGDLGHEEFVRGNTAWVEPQEQYHQCVVIVAVSVSSYAGALQVVSHGGTDCGLAQEVAATVVDRLPPGSDPHEQVDPSLHPQPTTAAATPTH